MMKYSVGLPTCMEGMMFPVPFATPDQVVEMGQPKRSDSCDHSRGLVWSGRSCCAAWLSTGDIQCLYQFLFVYALRSRT